MRCKHCGVGLNYYFNTEHSRRSSCMVSETKYHYFVTDVYYLLYTVYSSCFKKARVNAGFPMETPLQVRVPDTNGD